MIDASPISPLKVFVMMAPCIIPQDFIHFYYFTPVKLNKFLYSEMLDAFSSVVLTSVLEWPFSRVFPIGG
jgi:hypothetical protein